MFIFVFTASRLVDGIAVYSHSCACLARKHSKLSSFYVDVKHSLEFESSFVLRPTNCIYTHKNCKIWKCLSREDEDSWIIFYFKCRNFKRLQCQRVNDCIPVASCLSCQSFYSFVYKLLKVPHAKIYYIICLFVCLFIDNNTHRYIVVFIFWC